MGAAADAFDRYAIGVEDDESNAKWVAETVATDWALRVRCLAVGTLAARMHMLGAKLTAKP